MTLEEIESSSLDTLTSHAHRLQVVERQLGFLGSPIAREGDLLDPIGTVADFLTSEEMTPELAQRASRDSLPMPAPENREGYAGSNHVRYWVSGIRDFDVTESSPLPGPRAAFSFSSASRYSSNVFHSHEYVQRQWGRYFDVVDIKPMESGQQCVVLLSYTE